MVAARYSLLCRFVIARMRTKTRCRPGQIPARTGDCARATAGWRPGRGRSRRRLDAPLDLVLVRKIGVPFQPELAMGAVVDGAEPVIVRNQTLSLDWHQRRGVRKPCERELAEIECRRHRYLAGRSRAPIAGRTTIVIDDGIATGATMWAALQATRMRKPRKLVLAVPVAPTSTLEDLRGEADEIICLEAHENFGAIGLFYADFRQVSDDEVIGLLARIRLGSG